MKILPVLGLSGLRVVQSTFNKKASAYTDTLDRNLRFGAFFELAAAVFSLAYLLFAGTNGFTLTTLICAVITGCGFATELLTALAALRKAPLVLCTLCSLGGIIIPAVAGIFFFDEPMTWLQWVGVVLFFVAAVLLSPSTKADAPVKFGKAIPILVINFIVNGGLSTMSKYYAVRVENGNAAVFACWSYAVAALVFGALALLRRKKAVELNTQPLPKRAYLFGIILGVTCASIVYLNTVLSRSIPIVILNTVPNALCIAGSLFIGCWLFKEKFTPIRLIGAAVSVISTTLVITVL